MLIAMAVYDTEENCRSWMTEKTLTSLAETLDLSRHRLIVVDNASCRVTQDAFKKFKPVIASLIHLEENVGTARAINQAWHLRRPGEHCVKLDNDVVFHQAEWADWMEDVFERDPTIGICGLKRKDLAESPLAEGAMQSTLVMLSHERGQRWLVVEEVRGVIGTCLGFSSALLDKIGYLTQPGLYGFDDSLASVRARIAGFRRVFLHGFEIDHIDPGGSEYCKEKIRMANESFGVFNSTVVLLESGLIDIYDDGG